MQVTTDLINKLRQKTGAGVSKCKEALVATNGDIEAAIQWLRKIGVNPSKLSRPVGEGLVVTRIDPSGSNSVMFTLKCETDFAARSPRFLSLADKIAHDYLDTGIISNQTGGDLKAELSTGLGENIVIGTPMIGSLADDQKNSSVIGSYTHSNSKLAVLVALNAKKVATKNSPEFSQLLKDVAMHIAGANPVPKAASREDLDKAAIAREQEFIASLLASDPAFAKKQENIRQKVVEGKMGRFYKENVLVEQLFVKDETKTVGQHITEVGKKLGDEISVLWFIRMTLED